MLPTHQFVEKLENILYWSFSNSLNRWDDTFFSEKSFWSLYHVYELNNYI